MGEYYYRMNILLVCATFVLVTLGKTPGEIDAQFANLSYLRDCKNETEWALPKNNLTSEADMDSLIESFVIPAYTPEQKDCFLNNTKYPYAAQLMTTCLGLMAPGSIDGNATESDRIFASQGLMPFLVNGTRYSMCHTGMPCREFNHFVFNGTLLDMGIECGVAKD